CLRTVRTLLSFPTRRSSDLLPGREPRELDLPGRVIERCGSRARSRRHSRDVLRDACVLAEREEAAVRVVGLRRDANALAVSVRRSEEHTSELQSRENLVCRL